MIVYISTVFSIFWDAFIWDIGRKQIDKQIKITKVKYLDWMSAHPIAIVSLLEK